MRGSKLPGREIVAHVAKLMGVPHNKAIPIVRFVLERILADMRKCRNALTVDDALGVAARTMCARLEFTMDRVLAPKPSPKKEPAG